VPGEHVAAGAGRSNFAMERGTASWEQAGAAAAAPGGTAAWHRRRIAAYYDATQVLYSTIWSRMRVHYGLWEPGTRRHREAVRNLDRWVATRLALPAGGRVLDAGCGVGGTSLFLAEAHGLEITGITLSEVQLRRARRHAAHSRAVRVPTFQIGDYLRTGFADASFDGIVAIESVCYAARKEEFLAEAHRLLRPGGRLVVSDGFRAGPVPLALASRYRELLDGMALIDLAGVDDFDAALRRSGFVDVVCDDKHAAILPSARRIAALSRLGIGVCHLPCHLGLFPRAWRDHGRAGLAQLPLFASRALAYCVFSARKPLADAARE